MDKSREQFEEEFIKRTGLDTNDIFKIDDDTGEYYFMAPRQAWYWWQASRGSLEIELPEEVSHPDDYYQDGYNKAIEDITYLLTSIGVKVK